MTALDHARAQVTYWRTQLGAVTRKQRREADEQLQFWTGKAVMLALLGERS